MRDRAISKALRPRRRRSWYRRRLRIQRTLAVAILVLIIVAVCWQNAARFFPLPALHASQVLPDSFWTRANLLPANDLAWTLPHARRHPKYIERIPGVYPYSVIPGGVKSSGSLRETAARDRAVSRHFAHFDYSKARILRLAEPREVYVSYRIRDTIFWTRNKIRLSAGELLLTDGNITARAKCGNQISETAKPEVSDQEPDQDVLDQPVALEPLGPSLPLRSALSRPDLPGGPPIVPPVFGGGISFPLVSLAGAPVALNCESKEGELDKRCRHHHKPPRTPEPATVVLLASGLGIILWRYKNTRPLEA